jgi:nucleoid DNA-binding protein
MKLAELIDHVASEAGVEKSAAKKTVDAVLTGIVNAARKGEEVNLAGFVRNVIDQFG